MVGIWYYIDPTAAPEPTASSIPSPVPHNICVYDLKIKVFGV